MASYDSSGAFMRELRTHLRLKQEAFAERLGVSQAYISRVESGLFHPSAQVIQAAHRLKRESERHDPFLRVETGVAGSEGMESIVCLHEGRVHLTRFSKGFRMMDAMFESVENGAVLEGRIGDDADLHFDMLKQYDAFSEDVLEVRNVWVSETDSGVHFMSATSVPIPSWDGRWHIKSTHVQIDEQEFDRRKKFEILRT